MISKIDYDSEQDFDNPTGSVFCSHGESFLVKWDQVEEYMHIESAIWNQYLKDKAEEDKAVEEDKNTEPIKNKSLSKNKDFWQEDKELEEIFTRTYGPIEQSPVYTQSRLGYENKKAQTKKAYIKTEANKKLKEYLLVDGYNIIFSWDELKELATENMDAARYRLMDILCNYQGFKKCTVILVFDAYKVKGGLGEVQKYKNINVVYTKEAETVDQYIEKVTYEIAKDNHVVVATSRCLRAINNTG